MDLINLLLAAIVVSLSVAAALSPPAVAVELVITAYVAGRKLIRRMP